MLCRVFSDDVSALLHDRAVISRITETISALVFAVIMNSTATSSFSLLDEVSHSWADPYIDCSPKVQGSQPVKLI